MKKEVILNQTLTELENNDWGDPDQDSYSVQTCHKLRFKPLKEFEIEDLRIMIGQDIGLEYLLPLAIDQLEKNIFSEGMHYPGDLLCNVIRINPDFFKQNLELKEKVIDLTNTAKSEKTKLDEIDLKTFNKAFTEALNEFNE